MSNGRERQFTTFEDKEQVFTPKQTYHFKT